MRLLNILTLVYMLITLFATISGGYFIFRKLEAEIDFELGKELDRQIEAYAERIRNGVSPEVLVSERLEIKEIPLNLNEETLSLRDTVAYHDPMNREEKQLKASKSFKIGENHYRISYYNLVVETEDISETVVYTMVLVFVIQIFFVVFFFRGLSNRILKPFQNTLHQISYFDFHTDEPLKFSKTNITEFDRLNGFLEKMTQKLLNDYRQIKEYSENISHEIQTPAAVVSGKLDNLLNSEITEEQALLIYSALQNNEKINRIVKSLGLMAKLENFEFGANKAIDLKEILENNLNMLQELIGLNGLKINKEITGTSSVRIHPHIAEILFTNLLGNAIKHNIAGGWITVKLAGNQLVISNSGKAITHKPEELLQRFSKENKNSDSVGLGLAIVNQICKTYGFILGYGVIKDHIHTIQINFGKALQN